MASPWKQDFQKRCLPGLIVFCKFPGGAAENSGHWTVTQGGRSILTCKRAGQLHHLISSCITDHSRPFSTCDHPEIPLPDITPRVMSFYSYGKEGRKQALLHWGPSSLGNPQVPSLPCFAFTSLCIYNQVPRSPRVGFKSQAGDGTAHVSLSVPSKGVCLYLWSRAESSLALLGTWHCFCVCTWQYEAEVCCHLREECCLLVEEDDLRCAYSRLWTSATDSNTMASRGWGGIIK